MEKRKKKMSVKPLLQSRPLSMLLATQSHVAIDVAKQVANRQCLSDLQSNILGNMLTSLRQRAMINNTLQDTLQNK